MLRALLMRNRFGGKSVFAQRGTGVSRIEGFSDAAFGFAMTLLITSQQVPQTYRELLETMRGFYAFAVCFAILSTFWYRHYLFFRHYGLEDGYTAFLNAVLLFVVLFFVFPLKFMITVLFDQLLNHPRMVTLPGGGQEPAIHLDDLPVALQFYLLGLATVCLVFTLLYHHALTRREALRLSPLEVCETQIAMVNHAFPMSMCLICSALMLIKRDRPHVPVAIVFALTVMISIPIFHLFLNRWRKRFLDRLSVESPMTVIDGQDVSA